VTDGEKEIVQRFIMEEIRKLIAENREEILKRAKARVEEEKKKSDGAEA